MEQRTRLDETQLPAFRFRLRFGPGLQELEDRFREEYANAGLRAVRAALLIGLLIYMAHGVMDSALLGLGPTFRFIRYGLVTPLLAGAFLLSYAHRLRRIMQPITALVFLLFGASILYMIRIEDAAFKQTDVIGLVLLLIYGYSVPRLRLVYASAGGWSVLLLYGIMLRPFRDDPAFLFEYNFWYLFFANVVGMAIAYLFEHSARTQFLSRVIIEQQRNRYIDLSRNMERIIEKQTASLKEKNAALEKEIQSRRTSESSLARSEERYRMLAENSSDVLWAVDLETLFPIYVSPSVQRVVGFTAEEYVRMPLEQRHPPKAIERFAAGLAEELEKEAQGRAPPDRSRTIETEHYCKDGSIRWLEMVVTFLRNEEGKATGIMGVSRDITERKKAEEERRRLEAAVTQAAEAVIITNRTGVIEYVNPAFATLTGYGVAEAMGRTLAFLLPPEELETYRETLTRVAQRSTVLRRRVRHRRKDGEERIVDAVTSPMHEPANDTRHLVIVCRDVTSEIEAERRERDKQKMEALGTLAGGMAHEFNNILYPAMGYVEMALEDVPPAGDAADMLRSALRDLDRARDLVEHILRFSRQQGSESIPVQLAHLAKGVSKVVRASLPPGVRLELDLDGSGDLVCGDPADIHQVLMNLCSNAAQAMRATGGVLRIGVRGTVLSETVERAGFRVPPGGYVELCVADTGEGIPAGIMPRIFDHYFTTRTVGQGSGMGLAVVRGILDQHGAHILVDSSLGRGTRVQVYFPAAPPA